MTLDCANWGACRESGMSHFIFPRDYLDLLFHLFLDFHSVSFKIFLKKFCLDCGIQCSFKSRIIESMRLSEHTPFYTFHNSCAYYSDLFLLPSFFKVAFLEEYWLDWGQPVLLQILLNRKSVEVSEFVFSYSFIFHFIFSEIFLCKFFMMKTTTIN